MARPKKSKTALEIDYDKLAQAIIKAQQKANTQEIKATIVQAIEEVEQRKEDKTREIERIEEDNKKNLIRIIRLLLCDL